jgi:diguanylate cyclase (GGDEF)-like protein
MPTEILNGSLLITQSLIYFSFMALLFRLRSRLGLGVLTAALGTLHFLETYLASVFYVATPIGVISPGSSVLFSGKLVILLMIYIKEDAGAVRQPIYGILAGNLLTLVLAFLLRLHEVFVFSPGAQPQTGFIETIGVLMVWGTLLMFIDALALILIYERIGRRFRRAFMPRVLVALAAVLAFDQIGFYLALRWLAGVPIEAFYAGLAAKMCAAAVFAALAALYMRFVEPVELRIVQPIRDVFQALTYRERFEALAEHTGRDRTTMLLNHRSFMEHLAQAFERQGAMAEPRTLLLVELDASVFDDVHARLGRRNSEALLRSLSRCLEEVVHDRDEIFRLGHRQFALICHCPPAMARGVIDKLRLALKQRAPGYGADITVSVGGAGLSGSDDGPSRFALAEASLADARAVGGGVVRIAEPQTPPSPVIPGAVPALLAP